MGEVRMKTLKHDDLPSKPVPDTTTALDQIARWIDDYNENSPSLSASLSRTAHVKLKRLVCLIGQGFGC
jgi:hypothetical protein